MTASAAFQDSTNSSIPTGCCPTAAHHAGHCLASAAKVANGQPRLRPVNFTELMQSEPPGDYPLSVTAAWNVSLGRLRKTRPGN